MNTHADKTQENTMSPGRQESQSVSAADSQMQSSGESTFQFADNRPEAAVQRRFQEMANNSHQVKQATQLQAMADNYSTQQQPIQKKANNTGLPDNLKSGIENLSGYSMDDVKVHYNSDKPAQLQAHAYAQGTDIHLGPGQEKHLPHEAWHVVQQKQGRVKPTFQMKGKVNINDDAGLEKEADVMGVCAFNDQTQPTTSQMSSKNQRTSGGLQQPILQQKEAVIQAVWAHLNNAEGQSLNLRNEGNGVFSDSTGMRYHQIGVNRTNGRIIVGITRTRNREHDRSEEGEERGRARRRREPRDPQMTRRRRNRSPEEEGEVERSRSRDQDRGRQIESGTQGLRLRSSMRDEFRGARSYIESGISRDLNQQEWDVIADHPVENISGYWGCGFNPVEELSGQNGASCIPTSNRLYGLLGEGDQREGEFTNESQGITREQINELAREVEGEHENAIYQVAFGDSDHGFVIVIYLGENGEARAELIQSFANSESLGTNLMSETFCFTPAQVAGHLRNLLTRQTVRAQRDLFDGRIDNMHTGSIRNMRFRWNRAPLRDDSNTALQSELGQRASELLLSTNARTQQIGPGRTSREDRSARGNQENGMPAIAPPLAANLDLGGMIGHYFLAIGWAYNGPTFSVEFHFVRNNPQAARALLQGAGMTAAEATNFTTNFNQALNVVGNNMTGQSGNQSPQGEDRRLEAGNTDIRNVGYVSAELQETVLGQMGLYEQMLAIIRYLQQQQGNQQGQQ